MRKYTHKDFQSARTHITQTFGDRHKVFDASKYTTKTFFMLHKTELITIIQKHKPYQKFNFVSPIYTLHYALSSNFYSLLLTTHTNTKQHINTLFPSFIVSGQASQTPNNTHPKIFSNFCKTKKHINLTGEFKALLIRPM